MEIVQLNNERNAMQYVYDNGVPRKIPVDVFNELVQKSNSGKLPEFYVLMDKGEYIGYLLLLADKKENIPEPFTFLACHNGDQLSEGNHRELLEFIKVRGQEKGWRKLVWLAENEMKSV